MAEEKAKTHKMVGGGHVASATKEERSKPAKKALKRMEIERAANGGFTMRHHFAQEGPSYHEPEEHAFGKGDHVGVAKHLKKHLGLKLGGMMPAAAPQIPAGGGMSGAPSPAKPGTGDNDGDED